MLLKQPAAGGESSFAGFFLVVYVRRKETVMGLEMDLCYKEREKVPRLENAPVPLLKFDSLSQCGLVTHCFTTRFGGVSKGIFASMNLSFTRGDETGAVMENYRRLASQMGVLPERIVLVRQEHTVNVRKVTKADAGKGVTRERDAAGADAMITNEPGVVLGIFTADCVPVYLVDPVHGAIGVAHSGWRGSAGRIAAHTLVRMAEEYGTKPADAICAIGPSICRECYEVGSDVAEKFYAGFDTCYHKEILFPDGKGKYRLDLWRVNEIVLQEAGVPCGQIETTTLCTCCNPKVLFSHRASRGQRGTLAAFLMLNSNSSMRYLNCYAK